MGSGPGQFLLFHHLTVTAAGEVFVADFGNRRVQRFNSIGTFLSQWGLPIQPTGVAVGPDGTVYVSGIDRVWHLDANGDSLGVWGATGSDDGEFLFLTDVTVDDSGFVYVTDWENYRVQKFTGEGEFVTKWGVQGSGNGQFQVPVGIQAEPGGTILVADEGMRRMQRFDANGTFLFAWGTPGSGPGEWQGGPDKPCVDPNGFVVVPDTGNHRVQVYRPDGTFVLQWGSFGTGSGQFHFPTAVGVDGEGNLYVHDKDNYRVQKFTSMTTGVQQLQWGDVKGRFRR
jgi:DNA-binding beta-propeller fold protein YncE